MMYGIDFHYIIHDICKHVYKLLTDFYPNVIVLTLSMMIIMIVNKLFCKHQNIFHQAKIKLRNHNDKNNKKIVTNKNKDSLWIFFILICNLTFSKCYANYTHHDATSLLQLGAPWPMRGRNQYHSGVSPFRGSQSNRIKWSFPTEGHVRSSPAVTV